MNSNRPGHEAGCAAAPARKRHAPPPTDAGKALPLNDVSVKTGGVLQPRNDPRVLIHQGQIVAVIQRQTRVGINGRLRADEEDGVQHID